MDKRSALNTSAVRCLSGASMLVFAASARGQTQRVAGPLRSQHRIPHKCGGHVGLKKRAETVAGCFGKQLFDLVLMDVQMPEIDGFEATAAIREKEKGSGNHLRVVAMTAHAMVGDKERCLEAGYG